LFYEETIDKIAQRFHTMLKQLFISDNSVRIKKSIYELSLILPEEKILIESMNNTQVLFFSGSCIHHEFVSQVMKHPQKLAAELDEQSLTYAELLSYVQLLAIRLLDQYSIVPGEIIAQCVERSLSMVS
jgi:non-ribosomal peptide synthetase component F